MKVLLLGDVEQGKMFFEDDVEYANQGPFDCILLATHLQTIQRQNVVQVLTKLAAELVDGGRIIATVPALEWACKEIAAHLESMGLAPYTAIYGMAETPNMCGFTMPWLRLSFEEAGLTVIEARSEFYTLKFLIDGDTEVEERAQQHIIVGLLHKKDPAQAIDWMAEHDNSS